MDRNILAGRLIALEGGDGSGKTAQINKLKERIDQIGIPTRVWDFPQYGRGFYGEVVGKMLKGEYGELMTIHPTLAAIMFANDRLSVKSEMHDFMSLGGVALCNRYVDSNLAHGAAKFKDWSDSVEYLRVISELEFKINGLPKPDLTIYLANGAEISQKMIRSKGERQYLGGAEMDQAEKNLEHQRRAREVYEYLCETEARFRRVGCMNSEGEMKTIEQISEEVWTEVVMKFNF